MAAESSLSVERGPFRPSKSGRGGLRAVMRLLHLGAAPSCPAGSRLTLILLWLTSSVNTSSHPPIPSACVS
ncbi:hypothetical protein BJY01DRAFT_224765 [Aspergillus pseudoustus]|uniref:Uncharacterized protein n=1 Tax=Aspergillus pseudoustus TaxID=1810923 RepID=A0ABR4J4L6_9EURO